MTMFLFWEYRFSYCFLMLFLVTFLCLRYPWKKTILIAVLSFILTTGMEYEAFLSTYPSLTSQLLSTVLQVIIVQLTAFAIAKYRDFRTLFVSFSCATYVIAGNLFGLLTYHLTESTPISLALAVSVWLVLYAVLWKVIRRPLLQQQQRRNKGWVLLCIVPALFYVTEYVLFAEQNGVNSSPGTVIASILILIIMAVSYRFETMIWLAQERDNRLLRDKEVMETYSGALEKELEEIQRTEQRTAVIRHDMRHYIGMIAGLMQEEKYEEVKTVLQDMDGMLDAGTPKKYCTNVYLNAVVGQYAIRAAEAAVDFQVQMEVPPQLPFANAELAAAVSNLLNNALNACRKLPDSSQRKMEIHSKLVRKQFILTVSNPFTGTLQLDPETGLPLSDGGSDHGYGLRSVLAFTEKNKGFFDISSENNKFYARMLFNI